jgi:hypothetical protein
MQIYIKIPHNNPLLESTLGMRDIHTDSNDPQQDEIELEKSGDIYALQKYRLALWFNYDNKAWKLDFPRVLFITEIRLRENTQREMMLREKLQKLEEDPTNKTAEIQELRDKIQTSSQQYWWKERFWWTVRT